MDTCTCGKSHKHEIPQGDTFMSGKNGQIKEMLIPLIGVITDIRTETPDVKTFRVVGRDGHLSDAFQPLGRDSHRMLLEMEGVPFRLDCTVDLEKCLWRGPDDS